MAQGIVDALESVEVGHRHGKAVTAAPGLREGLFKAGRKQRPIGQAGERIMVAARVRSCSRLRCSVKSRPTTSKPAPLAAVSRIKRSSTRQFA